MKLNYRRTIFVGLAFFAISMFWQAYDSLVPKILKGENGFGLNYVVTGVVMAADNVFALFLLPLFGSLSDRTHTRWGRRTPYIVCGTVLAALTFVCAGFAVYGHSLVWFLISLGFVLVFMGTYRSPAVALMPDVTVKPLRSKANAIINLMGALGGLISLGLIAVLLTAKESGAEFLILFSVVSGIMLLSLVFFLAFVREPKFCREMEEYRLALGEDDGSEPAEAAATAINAETAAVAAEETGESTAEKIEENAEKAEKTGKTEKAGKAAKGEGKLPPDKRRSMIFLLASVFLWYMAYNAVTTGFSNYAEHVWLVAGGDFTLPLMVAQVAAIAMFVPVGLLASRIGRKKTVLIGVGCMIAAFSAAFFLGTNLFGVKIDFSGGVFREPMFYVMCVFFALCGIGWATINVNSYPMVVEMSRGTTVGRFTGYYYSASMAAQIVTPVLSGAFMDLDERTLFAYAALFMILALATMLCVRHGDAKPIPPKSALEHYDTAD